MDDINDCIHRLRAKAINKAKGILAAAANSSGNPLPIAKMQDEWIICEEIKRLRAQLKKENKT